MDKFVQRYAGVIKGIISGFDRIVFKGGIRPLMFADGAMSFFRSRGILNKNYRDWVMERSAELISDVEAYAKKACGKAIMPIASSNERKEELAHKQQKLSGIKSGLIGAWSCVEACNTFKARFDAAAGHPTLHSEYSRCKHLYLYYDHQDYGFMSVRLQTWFPFGIQIAFNGREWLKRLLDKEKIRYILHGNKFLHISDYAVAQKLLDKQPDARWNKMLASFLPDVFPSMSKTLGGHLSYYWTLWQSEWATDYIFNAPEDINPIMDKLIRHAFMTGKSQNVLHYMGKPVSADGQPHPLARPELLSRISLWHDGYRLRHWLNGNSLKIYNEQNLLRAEMTMNNPAAFKVYRHVEGNKKSGKTYLPMRKGIADIPLRTTISADANKRLMDQVATMSDDTPVKDMLKDISSRSVKHGRSTRALDITGKDRELLEALADPLYAVSGLSNKMMRLKLAGTDWAGNKSDKQLSSRISRHLRLLRDHGLIRKVQNQRKYMLTDKGRNVTTLLLALLSASTQQLMEKAA